MEQTQPESDQGPFARAQRKLLGDHLVRTEGTSAALEPQVASRPPVCVSISIYICVCICS